MSETDVCLLLEGTYPYVPGGVSTWTHNLIASHKHYRFHIVCILPPHFPLKKRFELPENVVGLDHVYVQKMPEGADEIPAKIRKQFFEKLEPSLLRIQNKGRLKDLEDILNLFKEVNVPLGNEILMRSENAWIVLVRMYNAILGHSCFLDFFWSWRGLMGGLFSILLAPLPQAKVYHALCTGYAGLFMARANLETKRPCIITEHGIYTNERRIEIASAKWIHDQISLNLNVEREKFERGLKDLWIDTFSSYSKICYEAACTIITLFEGNQALQRADGADLEKLMVIPNGVDLDIYKGIKPKLPHPPTIALIGRVVPIKDIKSFIRATDLLKEKIPNLKAFIIGPFDEDPAYYEECVDYVKALRLENTIEFTGKVNTLDYLPLIDVMVLSSISEAQPLVILETGACGIPTVATDVGSCRELLYGKPGRDDHLGKGGIVVPLANPLEISLACLKLLVNNEMYEACSKAMRERVRLYYNKADQTRAYNELYSELIKWQG